MSLFDHDHSEFVGKALYAGSTHWRAAGPFSAVGLHNAANFILNCTSDGDMPTELKLFSLGKDVDERGHATSHVWESAMDLVVLHMMAATNYYESNPRFCCPLHSHSDQGVDTWAIYYHTRLQLDCWSHFERVAESDRFRWKGMPFEASWMTPHIRKEVDLVLEDKIPMWKETDSG